MDTFMEKEINEIPKVIEKILATYRKDKTITQSIAKWHGLLQKAPCVHICACGTSYHAGLIIGNLIEKHLRIRVKTHIASEFTGDTILNEKEIAMVISQSGETTDTLAAMQILKSHKLPIVALCNTADSTITKQSDITFPLLCDKEVAVASTKVFVASLLVGSILIGKFTPADFAPLSKMATKLLSTSIPVGEYEKIFFVGRGLDYFLALESALKVKEVTYRHCEGHATGEFKHGPMSLVDDKTLSIVYLSSTNTTISKIKECGGKVVELPDPAPKNPLSFIAKVIPAQIFALRQSQRLGITTDKPRNLTKSVI